MKAIVSAFNLTLNNYQARTENDIALSFAVIDGAKLELNEELEVAITSLIAKQSLTRAKSGAEVKIRISEQDLHDLRRTSASHGDPRTPSEERLSEA